MAVDSALSGGGFYSETSGVTEKHVAKSEVILCAGAGNQKNGRWMAVSNGYSTIKKPLGYDITNKHTHMKQEFGVTTLCQVLERPDVLSVGGHRRPLHHGGNIFRKPVYFLVKNTMPS
jgi:hypothetical protein